MSALYSTLSIRELALSIHLGWPEEERITKQTVLLTITMQFKQPPIACDTDNLSDTFCYATLIEKIRALVANKHFLLIEHLSKALFTFIKSEIANDMKLQITVLKHPPIPDFSGDVTFTYGDPL